VQAKQVEHEKATMSEATYIHLDVDLESLPCNKAFQDPDHLLRRLANLFGSHAKKARQVRNIGVWSCQMKDTQSAQAAVEHLKAKVDGISVSWDMVTLNEEAFRTKVQEHVRKALEKLDYSTIQATEAAATASLALSDEKDLVSYASSYIQCCKDHQAQCEKMAQCGAPTAANTQVTQDVTNSIADMNIDSPDEESPVKSPNATINEDQLPAVIGHPSKEQKEAAQEEANIQELTACNLRAELKRANEEHSNRSAMLLSELEQERLARQAAENALKNATDALAAETRQRKEAEDAFAASEAQQRAAASKVADTAEEANATSEGKLAALQQKLQEAKDHTEELQLRLAEKSGASDATVRALDEAWHAYKEEPARDSTAEEAARNGYQEVGTFVHQA
jgi:hypothetical protein